MGWNERESEAKGEGEEGRDDRNGVRVDSVERGLAVRVEVPRKGVIRVGRDWARGLERMVWADGRRERRIRGMVRGVCSVYFGLESMGNCPLSSYYELIVPRSSYSRRRARRRRCLCHLL
jgi:hypothetical protein